MSKPVTRRQAIILSILTAIACIGGILGLQSQSDQKYEQARYAYDVDQYESCILRQQNIHAGNKRAAVLREFLQIAADGRIAAANTFKSAGDQTQYQINWGTAQRELELKAEVEDAEFPFCVKPPAPDGVDEVKLEEAPFNDQAEE